MSTSTQSLWRRLTAPFCSRSPAGRSEPDSPGGEPNFVTGPKETIELAGEGQERPGPLARWSRRDQAIIQLQEGYEKVSRAVEDIQQHLAQQGERTERICTALERIAKVMADSPQIARQQAQTLDHIAGQIEVANARSQQLAEVIGELPRAARIQTETLGGIGRQLEISNEQSAVASQTMDRLGASIRTLGESSQAQGEILREMNEKAAEQTEQLSRMIERQSRRFTGLFVVTLLMALAAIGAMLVGLMVARP